MTIQKKKIKIKNLFFIITIFVVFSCKTSSIVTMKPIEKTNRNCPDDGVCSIEIIPNTSIQLIADETGALFPKFLNNDTVVLKYEYKRDEQPQLADDEYSELIYLEISKEDLEHEIQNLDLNKMKLVYARLCFCRGASGYYKITEGNISIKKQKNKEYHIELSFHTNEVPQIINHISENFVIE